MENLRNYNEIKVLLEEYKDLYVLIFKSRTDQSKCAYDTLAKVEKEMETKSLYMVDVSKTNDIHGHFGIKTAPSLLEFKAGKLTNVIKGCQSEKFYSNYFSANFSSATANRSGKTHSVTVYTTPTCSWCNTLKSYFRTNNVRFREIDVTKDERAAKEMVQRSGQQGVPQSLIDGQVVVGFDKSKIDNLLELNVQA